MLTFSSPLTISGGNPKMNWRDCAQTVTCKVSKTCRSVQHFVSNVRLQSNEVWHVLTRDHRVLSVTHTCDWYELHLFLLLSHTSFITLWPVLISHSIEGRRLRWPRWPITYRYAVLAEGHVSQYQAGSTHGVTLLTTPMPLTLGQTVR